MICKFSIGQQVVCIVEEWTSRYLYSAAPAKGHVYTVREMFPGKLTPHFGMECPSGVWLTLEGWGGYYCSGEFRPAKPTNIKAIERLLDVSPEDRCDIDILDDALARMEADGVLKRSILV